MGDNILECRAYKWTLFAEALNWALFSCWTVLLEVAASGSFCAGVWVLSVLNARAWMSLVTNEIIAMSSSSRACATIDSVVVMKECLWSGKSSLFSRMAVSEKAITGVGYCCWWWFISWVSVFLKVAPLNVREQAGGILWMFLVLQVGTNVYCHILGLLLCRSDRNTAWRVIIGDQYSFCVWAARHSVPGCCLEQ